MSIASIPVVYELIKIIIILMKIKYSVDGQHRHGKVYLQSEMHERENAMEIDVRMMHRFCTGECFYLPSECDDTKSLNCANIVSIQKYEPRCSDPTAVDLCTRTGHLFMISMLRTLPAKVIHTKRYMYKETGDTTIRCKIEPFVAISFSNNTETVVTPTDPQNNEVGDMFYACIASDAYVTSWINPIKKKPKVVPTCMDNFKPSEPPEGNLEYERLMHTRPYPGMGASVLWSKIVTRYDQFAMGCKFIISNLRKDLYVQLNINGTVQLPLFKNKYIKVANGFAYVKNGVVEDIIFRDTPGKSIAVIPDLPDQASLIAFQGLDSWNVSTMEFRKPPQKPFIQDLKNQIAAKEMYKVYNLCSNRRGLCFTREDEPYCATSHSCHYLVALQSLNKQFSTLRFYLITQPLRRRGILSNVHPKSWSGVGFSNDTKMGKDLIFVCEFYGQQEALIKVAYNANSMPIFSSSEEEPLTEFSPVQTYIDPSNDATLCIFDVNAKNITFPAFYYSPVGTSPSDTEAWPKLHFSLSHHEFYILMAQGTTVYYDEKISKHTRSGVAPSKFSQDIYWNHVSGQDTLHHPNNPFILLLTSFPFSFFLQ